jgi:O-antigen biosynthesis protein
MVQTHRNWQLCICDDGSTDPNIVALLAQFEARDSRIVVTRPEKNLGIAGASNLAAGLATSDIIAFLDHDDELHPQAVAEIAHAWDADPTIDLSYTDEDKLDFDGSHCDPFIKPDWSPEYLCSTMYLLHCLCIRRCLFWEIGGIRSEYDGAQDYDLALRASARARRVHHIPRILYHWRKLPGSASATVDAKPYSADAGRRALASAAALMEPPAKADYGLLPGTYRLRRDGSPRPPVTLVVISSDPVSDVQGRGSIRILPNFLRSVIERSTYPDYRVLVVDDGEPSSETVDILAGCSGKRISHERDDTEGFNFARKVNFAVRHVETEHFVLLNDDLEVISPDWIEALMDYLVIPEVAAVGGRLLFADGSTQHAGVIGKPWVPDHVFYRMPKDQVGYYGFSHVVRNYSAVTAAVVASKRGVFDEIGGFDEAFAHDFNDVDFCLRARSQGYRIVYTPFCELYHFEHASLVRSKPRRQEIELFFNRWGSWTESDPYYTPI